MKKYTFVSLAGILFFITGCTQFSMPNKLQVKTTAEYNFTLLDYEKDFSSYFSVKSLKEKIGESVPNLELYDYNPGGNQAGQSFVLRMPIQEVPLDFGSYLENIDLGKDLEAMSFTQDINVPEVNINNTQEMDLTAINNVLIGCFGITDAVIDGTKQKINFDSSKFESMDFFEGKFIVFTETATGTVKLYSPKETLIGSGTIQNNRVLFNMANKSLSSDETYIQFEDADSGTFSASLNMDTKIKIAKGINISACEDTTISVDDITFNTGSTDSSLQECIFSDDSKMTFKLETTGWSGVSIEKEVKLTGGLEVTCTTQDTISLKDKRFINQDITAKNKFKIGFTDAYIDFTAKPTFQICTENIGFKSITAKVPDSLNTSINVNQDLSESASSIIKKIKWAENCGIQVDYVNTFPAGNDFALKNVKSTFLGLGPQSANLTGGSESHVDFLTDTVTETPITPTTKIDFTATLELPGYNSGERTFTFVNVVPGQSYRIGLSIKPKFDWESITVNLESIGEIKGDTEVALNPVQMLGAIDEALNITDDTEKISKNLKLSSLKVHLFCEKPDISLFNGCGFNGVIKLSGGSNSCYLLGTAGSPDVSADMPFSAEPKLTKNANETIISTVSGGLSGDLASVVNNLGDSEKLKMEYDLSFFATGGEKEITKADLQNSQQTSLKIIAYLVFPLNFNLENQLKIDIMSIAGKTFNAGDPDLLGRTTPTATDGKIKKFLDIIESASVMYTPSKKPVISSAPVYISVDLDEKNPGVHAYDFTQQNLSLNGGMYSENPVNILENLIYPDIKLVMEKGVITIPRQMAFKTRIDLSLKTNGEPLDLVGGDN